MLYPNSTHTPFGPSIRRVYESLIKRSKGDGYVIDVNSGRGKMTISLIARNKE